MWFKKKVEKRKGTDFSKYSIRINGKTMCAYEALTGKPFLKIETEEEVMALFYCSLVVNNKDFATLEYRTFEYLIRDPEVADWMVREYKATGSFLAQFKSTVGEMEDDADGGNEKDEPKPFYMLEAISGLIVKMGIDPHYVMYDMEEWEISYYYRMMRDMDRDRLTEERLWTYLTILPHVGKKLGSPQKMLPFEWEKNDKREKRDFENNAKAAFAFLTGNKNNGEGRHDDSPEQGGV